MRTNLTHLELIQPMLFGVLRLLSHVYSYYVPVCLPDFVLLLMLLVHFIWSMYNGVSFRLCNLSFPFVSWCWRRAFDCFPLGNCNSAALEWIVFMYAFFTLIHRSHPLFLHNAFTFLFSPKTCAITINRAVFIFGWLLKGMVLPFRMH